MDLKSTYEVDPTKESEGVWVPWEDAQIKVGRVGGPAYQKALRARTKMGSRGFRQTDEHQTNILCEVMADAVLLDWKGIKEGGKPVPFSRDNAYAMLKKYAQFRDEVTALASNFELFRTEEEDDAEKNSLTGSASTSKPTPKN